MPIASEHIRLMMMKRAAAAKDPGAEAMASAAKQAPSATPIPTMVPPADPAATGTGDGGQREAQLQRELERKDKELSSLRNNNQVLNVQMAHLKSMAELEKRKAKELNDIDKREQKYRQTVAAEDAKMQQRKEQMTAAEVKHQAQLEIDTANHRAQLAEDKANQQASLAQSQAQTVAQDARRNAQEYVRMAEDARNEADKHMLNKEKNITGMQKELYTREKMEDDRNNRAAMNQAKLEAQQQNQAQRLQLNQQNQAQRLQLNQQNQEQRMQMAQRKAMRAEQQQDAAREQKQMMQQQMPQPQTPQMGKMAAAAPAPAPAPQPTPQPAQAPSTAPQQTPAPAPAPQQAPAQQPQPQQAAPARPAAAPQPAKPSFAPNSFKRDDKFVIPGNIGAAHDMFQADKPEMTRWGDATRYTRVQNFLQQKAEAAMASGNKAMAARYMNQWKAYEAKRQNAIIDGTAAWQGRMIAQQAMMNNDQNFSASRVVGLQRAADSIKAFERAGKPLTPAQRAQMNAFANASKLLKGHYEKILNDPNASPQAKLEAKANMVSMNEYTAKRPQGLWSGMKYGVGQAVSGISRLFGGSGKTGSDWGQTSMQDEVLDKAKTLEESKGNILSAWANGQGLENAGQELSESWDALKNGEIAKGLGKGLWGSLKGLGSALIANPLKEVLDGVYKVPANYVRSSNIIDQFDGTSRGWLYGVNGDNEGERQMAESVLNNTGLPQGLFGATTGALASELGVPLAMALPAAKGLQGVKMLAKVPGVRQLSNFSSKIDNVLPRGAKWYSPKNLVNPTTLPGALALGVAASPYSYENAITGDVGAMGDDIYDEMSKYQEEMTPAQRKELADREKMWQDAGVQPTDLWKSAAARMMHKMAAKEEKKGPSAPRYAVPRTQISVPGGGEQSPQEIVMASGSGGKLPVVYGVTDGPTERDTGGPIAQNAQERNMGFGNDHLHTMTSRGQESASILRNPWVQMGLNMLGLGMNTTPTVKRVGEVPINLDVLTTAPNNALEVARMNNPYGLTAEGARLMQSVQRPRSDFSMYNYGNYFTR